MFKTPLVVAGSVESVSAIADPRAQVCQVPADLRSDAAREVIATVLERYLRQARLSPIELVYHFEHAFLLHDTGTALQGALQKVAIAQTQGTKLPAVGRLKELMALVDSAISELRRLREQEPAVPLTADSFAVIARRSRDAALRQIAAHLAPIKTWRDKLVAIAKLATAEDDADVLVPIDIVLADIVGSTALFEEWTRNGELINQVLAMIAAHGGELPPPADDPGADVASFNSLMASNHLVRCRSALQRRILRELLPPSVLVEDRALQRQAEAWTRLHTAIQGSRPLSADVELTEVIEARCLRAINPENIDLYLSRIPTLAEKLTRLLDLADRVPITTVKLAVLEFFRTKLAMDQLGRENALGRNGLLPVLTGLHHRVDALQLDNQHKTTTFEAIDSMMLKILSTDILNVPPRALPERVVWLLKACAATPLPPGRARQYAAETVQRTLRNKDVLATMLRRHQTDGERAQAFAALNDLATTSGLGDLR